MNENNIQLALNLTAPQGAVLTSQEIARCRLQHFSVELLSLLFKPGIRYFKKSRRLSDYFALKGHWFLDSRLKWNAEKEAFAIRSPFDGHYELLGIEQWLDIVHMMNPDVLLLPEAFYSEKNKWFSKLHPSINCYISAPASLQQYPEGELLISEQQAGVILVTERSWPELAGIQAHHGEIILVSAKPLTDAVDGIVYQQNQQIDIKEKQWQNDFKSIDKNCQCSSCQQKLTRGYFYHLYQQTPLLCHRFLAEHNLWVCQQHLHQVKS